MNCPRVDELLLDSLDEPLTAPDRADVDAHLASCPACVGNLQAYVTTIGILRDLGRIEATEAAPPLSDELVRRILAQRDGAQSDKESRRTG